MALQDKSSYTIYYDGSMRPQARDHYFTTNIEWTVINQDAVTNTSTIQVNYTLTSSLALSRIDLRRADYYLDDALFDVQGGSYSSDWVKFYDIAANTPVTLYSTTLEIPHQSSASQEFSLEWRIHLDMYDADLGLTVYNRDIEGVVLHGPTYFVLDNIVRSAFITSILDGSETCTDEDGFTFYYVNPMGEEASLLQAALSISNGSEMELQYRDINKTTDSYTFPMTDADWDKIYAKTLDKKITDNIPVKIYLKSIVPGDDGLETVVDTRSILMSYINYMPTLNPVFIDINPVTTALTGNPEIFVRYASNVQFSLNAEPKKQATLTNYYAANGDNTIFALNGVLEGVTSRDFIAQVQDSRKFTKEYIEEHTREQGNWVEYVPLTCKVKNGLLDANGNLVVTVSGKYYGGSFGKEDNELSLEYNIRKSGDGTFLPITVSNVRVDEDNNYTYSFTLTGLDYTDRHYLSVRATDKINSQGSVTSTIIGAVPVFEWSKNDFDFYVPVRINNDSVPTIREQGEYLGWTYRKWTDGTAECWMNYSVDTAITNSTAGGWYASGNLTLTNLTLPFTFKERPTVTVSTMPTGNSWAIVFPGSTAGSTTQTGSFQLLGTTSTSSKTYLLSYQVRGKWK